MWGDVLLLLLSLALLTGGADFLVKGSGSLARRLGLTPLVIGLTVVAFGTSSPELAVSLDAAVTGHGDMVLGNVVGSNIFNILGILGISSAVRPLSAPGVGMREAWAMPAFAVAAVPLLWTRRRLMRWEGAVLLLGYGAYLWMVWPAG